MPVPESQTIMLPPLGSVRDGNEHTASELVPCLPTGSSLLPRSEMSESTAARRDSEAECTGPIRI